MPVSSPPVSPFRDFFYFTHYDKTCDDSFRRLEPYSSVDYNVPLSGRTPVILIHGWQQNLTRCASFIGFDPSLDHFGSLIERLKPLPEYKLYIAKYPSMNPIIDASDFLLREMRSQMLTNNDKRPILIGHSMGGLVGRGTMFLAQSDEIRGLITLGTPHEGTPLATGWEGTRCDELFVSVSHKWWCGLAVIAELTTILSTPGVTDMAPGKPAVQLGGQANGSKIFTLAGRVPIEDIGDFWIRGIAEITGFISDNDGIVETTSAAPHWTVWQTPLTGYDHFEMSRGNAVGGTLLDEDLFVRIIDLLGRIAGENAVSGRVVDQFTNRPLPGISVSMSGLTARTDVSGMFHIPGSPTTTPRAISFFGPGVHTRNTYVVGGAFEWPVVPLSFPMTTFDDVARDHPGHLGATTRWTRNPHVYIDVIPRGFSNLPSTWINEVEGALRQWIPYWTGQQAIASTVTRTVNPPTDYTPNTIVVRFDASIRDGSPDAVGLSDWRADVRGNITSALIKLYYAGRSVETNSETRRRLLTVSAGHAVGYGSRERLGSSTIFHRLEWADFSAPTIFDQQARLFLYGRQPHNVTADTDVLENISGAVIPAGMKGEATTVIEADQLRLDLIE